MKNIIKKLDTAQNLATGGSIFSAAIALGLTISQSISYLMGDGGITIRGVSIMKSLYYFIIAIICLVIIIFVLDVAIEWAEKHKEFNTYSRIPKYCVGDIVLLSIDTGILRHGAVVDKIVSTRTDKGESRTCITYKINLDSTYACPTWYKSCIEVEEEKIICKLPCL